MIQYPIINTKIKMVLGTVGNDDIHGTIGVDSIDAGIGNDTLNGMSGNDMLYGGAGNDIFIGGDGDDVLYGGDGDDTASYSTAILGIVANLASITPQNTGITGIDKFISIENLIGGLGADFLGGSDIANLLDGGDSNDTLNGYSGNDSLWGGSGNDLLLGGLGDDVLNGGLGDDVIYGGAGIDTVSYSLETAGIIANLKTSVATGGLIGTDLLYNIENLSGGAGNDSLTGDNAHNKLSGGDGADTLDGGAGNDTLFGGAGNDLLTAGIGDDVLSGGSDDDTLDGGTGSDWVSYEGQTFAVIVDLSQGTVEKAEGAGIDHFLNIENIQGSDYSCTLLGDSSANRINGGVSGDTLDGGAGADTLSGGKGDDTYYTENIGDSVLEGQAGGIDSVFSQVSFSLGDYIENLTLLGSAKQATGNAEANQLTGNELSNILSGLDGNDTLYGGGGNDLISGGDGNDLLFGGAGNDTLSGGAGMDTASYIGAAENLSLSLAISTSQPENSLGTDMLFGIENLISGSGNDHVVGDSNANMLDGGIGDDTLEGGAGNDSLAGGMGSDTASYTTATTGVTVSLAIATPQNTLGAGTDSLSGIENLIGSGLSDNLTGDASNNSITGGNGGDLITGSGGTDDLVGGGGNDIFIFTRAADLTGSETVTGDDGIDELRFAATAASTLTLSQNVQVEKVVIGTGLAATAVQSGITALNIDASLAANDITLVGNAGNNTLMGSSHNDSLNGGAGNDTLTGGSGEDVFVFDFTPSARGSKDTITDFTTGEDHIWLSKAAMLSIGANSGQLNDSAFRSEAGSSSGHDATDRIIYNSSTGALYYDADGSGKTASVKIAQIGTPQDHPPLLSASDFVIF